MLRCGRRPQIGVSGHSEQNGPAAVREAEETGAEELVSACPFCYQGLQVGITATGSNLVMRDISFLVEASLKDEQSDEPKKERKGSKDPQNP
jgi:Fe-S oxidoreductase